MADPHDDQPRGARRPGSGPGPGRERPRAAPERPLPGPGPLEPRRLDPRTDSDGEEFRGTRTGRGGGGRRGLPPVRHRALRWMVAGLSAVVLATAAAGALEYLRLDGSIRSLPLFGGLSGDAGAERADAFGRTPLNVLVIGSDSRADPADCRLGGDCGPGRNADTAMVLHLSADRAHAAVLSVPRDTVTDLPACRTPQGGTVPARRGPLNSTLQYGPGCTVAAVHGLTRLPIDHFVLADFAGVVRMSDAVGGVPVCVDRDVYDPYSGLRLSAGRHLVRGRGALAFLRSRHAFGDGGDLGRADAQHLFLSALAVRMRDAGAFADPAGLLALAQAATGALTVDPGLASLSRLAGLVADLRKVPPEQMVFTTVPTRPDPRDRDRLVPGPGADRVFALIASDLPLRVSGPPATPLVPAATVAPAGRPPGPVLGPRAAGPPADETFEGEALGYAPAGGAGVGAAAGSGTGMGMRSGAAAGTGAGAGVPILTAAVLARYAAGTAAATGDTDGTDGTAAVTGRVASVGGCARVARQATVTLGGARMNPTAAFAATPRTPLSAR